MKRWFLKKLPNREQLLANRWLRPFAHRLEHPLLWHMNRRSIARGLALGLFAGFLLPIGQIFLAAFLAMTVRANVLIAAGATLVTNPFTFPPIYFAAYKVGCGITGMKAAPRDMPQPTDMILRFHQIATPTVVGLLLFAFLSALAGYVAVHIYWRWRLSRRWSRRKAHRAARARAA